MSALPWAVCYVVSAQGSALQVASVPDWVMRDAVAFVEMFQRAVTIATDAHRPRLAVLRNGIKQACSQLPKGRSCDTPTGVIALSTNDNLAIVYLLFANLIALSINALSTKPNTLKHNCRHLEAGQGPATRGNGTPQQ